MKLIVFSILLAFATASLAVSFEETLIKPAHPNATIIKCYAKTIRTVVENEKNATLIEHLTPYQRRLEGALRHLEYCEGFECAVHVMVTVISIRKIDVFLKQNNPTVFTKIQTVFGNTCVEQNSESLDWAHPKNELIVCYENTIRMIVDNDGNASLVEYLAPHQKRLERAVYRLHTCEDFECVVSVTIASYSIQRIESYLKKHAPALLHKIQAVYQAACVEPKQYSVSLGHPQAKSFRCLANHTNLAIEKSKNTTLIDLMRKDQLKLERSIYRLETCEGVECVIPFITTKYFLKRIDGYILKNHPKMWERIQENFKKNCVDDHPLEWFALALEQPSQIAFQTKALPSRI